MRVLRGFECQSSFVDKQQIIRKINRQGIKKGEKRTVAERSLKMGLQDQEKIKEECETGFRGDTEPCQSPWKSRKTRPWKTDGEAKNSPSGLLR